MAVQESDEIITRLAITAGSDLDGTAVSEGVPEADVTMSVIAIRRPGDGWILVADADAELRGGDVVIAKGTRTAADQFDALADA